MDRKALFLHLDDVTGRKLTIDKALGFEKFFLALGKTKALGDHEFEAVSGKVGKFLSKKNYKKEKERIY